MEVKEKTSSKAGIVLQYAILAVVILLGALLCLYGVRSPIDRKIAQSQTQVIRNAAQQNRLRAQDALEAAERSTAAWASLMCSDKHAYISELQEAVAQSNALLGSSQL